MKPGKTLLFIIGVIILLALTMWVTPSEGVKIGQFTFHMPTFSELFPGEKENFTDVSEILENQFNIDSLVEVDGDSLTHIIHKANYDSLISKLTKIEMTESGLKDLRHFFERLEKDSVTRIMHYGDSQIEGDRITAFVRNKMRMRFGGTGPGLRPGVQPYDYVFTAFQENTENWERYPVYGDIDSTLMHNNYGVMGAFSRFAPHAVDSVSFSDSVNYNAGLIISRSNYSFKPSGRYENLRLFYGNSRGPVSVEVYAGGEIILCDTLNANVDYNVLECALPDTTHQISLFFEGYDSPDIYGIELASKKGLIMDNIPLRGSSGLIFTKSNLEHSRKMFNDLNPALFILQFGGNVMPYITEEDAIKKYAKRFKRQLERIQLLCPDAAIIVIGPSDMSTKVKEKYITYPHLPEVVAALKDVALNSGCAFWNMYEAMGGKNSMPSWVNAEPELARPDYTHFSSKGARLIANMFYNALILEYNNYLEVTQKVRDKTALQDNQIPPKPGKDKTVNIN